MSAKQDAIIRRVQRGERIAAIREALDMKGEEFGAALSKRLQALGVTAVYNRDKVSRLESGGRQLTVEEAVVIAQMDPKQRGGVWLIFGERSKAVDRGMFTKRAG